MARNGSGTMSVINTYVSGNVITASAQNQNAADFAAELTNSVAADGQTSMTGPLKLANGSAAAPAHTFASDTDTGGYRIGANNYGIAVGGSKIVDVSATGISITGTLAASGVISTTDTTDSSSTSTGSGVFPGGLGVAKKVYVGTAIFNADGTKTNPAYSWSGDTDTGFYRIGANNIGISCGDTKIFDITTAGATLTGALTVSNGFTVSAGSVSLPAGSIANAALAAPGGLVKIATQTASNSATIDFVHGTGGVVLDDTYDHYEIVLDSVVPASDTVGLRLRIGTGGTPTYQTANYDWGSELYYSGGSLTPNAETSGDAIGLGYGATNVTVGLSNVAGEGGVSGVVQFSNPEASIYPKFRHDIDHFNAGGNAQACWGCGVYKSAGAITAVRFYMTSGNISSGRFTLYGRTKA